MAKAVKKKGKNRRLKRSIRKTLGALFLASALAVAAIPTEGLQAADGDIMSLADPEYKSGSVTISNIFDYVPLVDTSATIYTTGDSRFQFAYVSPNTGQESGVDNRVAVILGYNNIGQLEGGALTIPDTVEAYKKYAFGTTTGDYAAVNMDGEYLYYLRWKNRTDAQGNTIYETNPDGSIKLDALGNPVPQQVEDYKPCYYADRSIWVGDEELYINTGTTVSGGNTIPTYAVSRRERIRAATVAYIGNQYLVENNGTWTIASENKGIITQKENGIFYGETNINTLKVGENLEGIGNYAFAGCAGLNSITLGNGLQALGNSAFEDCVNLNAVNIDPGAKLPIIGSRCFYNCQKLGSFDLPYGTQKIGDEAFAGCTSLQTVNLISTAKDENGELMNGLLNEIGNGVFRGCSGLKQVSFPSTFNNSGKGVDVSEFQGCGALQYIKTDGNTSFNLTEGNCDAFKFKEFKAMILPTFYLEGPKNETLHRTSTAQRIAFRFFDTGLNKYVYELVVEEADGKTATYWVDDNNQLVKCDMAAGMATVTLPETIGPKNITSIGSTTFQNKCALRRITIPASVTSIASDAFKGCHHLENVIFTNAENIKSIGSGAFNTQDVVLHTDCPDQTQSPSSYLNFTGTISADCVPFQYAMNPSEYINTASQYRTYITYYSGWPTNLEVRYNETTGLNELVNYPTLEDLKNGVYTAKKPGSNEYVYAYMTDALASAANEAVAKYNATGTLTDYEKQIINAALELKLPEGIESIATVDAQGNLVADPDAGSGSGSVSGGDADSGYMGLFTYKEAADKVWGSKAYKTLETNGLLAVNDGAFKNCDTITGVTFNGPLKSIGDYAFDGCDNLSAVSISESATELGLRPFTNCAGLSTVNFNGSEHFRCDNSIIYTLDSAGNREAIVEYLCGRGIPTIEADELAGIKSIYPEAFMDTGVMTVDFSQTQLTNMPENVFRRTKNLFQVVLPNTCTSISNAAFTDSGLFQITIPRSVAVINNGAFGNIDGGEYEGMTDLGRLIFVTPEDSVAATFAKENGITRKDYVEPIYHKVTFFGWDGTILGILEKVEEGKAAEPPFEIPEREGYTFSGWVPPVDCVTEDITTTAQYTPIDPETQKVTVTFMDDDQTTVLWTETTTKGGSVRPPRDPSREGYVFTGWLGAKIENDKIENVQQDMTVYAQYEKVDSSDNTHLVRFYDDDKTTLLSYQRVEDGKDAKLPKDPPPKAGYTFYGWQPEPTNVITDMDVYARYVQDNGNNGGNGTSSGNGSGNNGNNGSNGGNGTTSGNGSGSNGGTSKFYTLTVQNGSGSGSYVAGAQPIVIANDPSSTQEFSHWTIEPANTTIASKVLSATVITMPEENVTVTAHYRARTSSSNGSGNTSSANSGRRPNNTGSISNGGTTVVIDKNGISNTGVVAATVNGSSDNFVIKITESTEATEAVVRALMAEYGNLDNIKYFPMDISLYDSTGTNKITDTTGLSVSITLPIPDSLITYAGNNKVAGVVSDRLDKLSPKFTTISGVSCITFTAEHFSPYVIYVDTANLSAGGNADATPKTGDGIHPKWFLSIGLACLSFVMFMQKDRKKMRKVKVKAKA